MSLSSFDPTKAVTFDLAQGIVRLDDDSARILVPASALLSLAKAAGPQAVTSFAHSLGEPLGARAAKQLSGAEALRAASPETVIEHLAGELALVGLGSLALERWGRALLLVVERSPLAQDANLLGGVLEGALQGATGRAIHCVLLNDGSQCRFLITGEAAALRARQWLAEGISWGEVLARLHSPKGGAS